MEVVYEETVKPRGPYSFKLTASVYALSYEFDGRRAYIPLAIEGIATLVLAERVEGGVSLRVVSQRRESWVVEGALSKAKHILALEEDLTDFYRLVARDNLLWPIATVLRGIHMRAAPGLWEGLIIAVCQQNASFKQGWRMVSSIRRMFGRRIEYGGASFYTYPTPNDIIREGGNLRGAGVGYRAETLLRAAREAASGGNPLDVKGVGQYTERVARIVGLRDYSEMPVDRWFSRLIPLAYLGREEPMSVEEVEEFARVKWGRWAGLAALMLTVVTEAKPFNRVRERIKRKSMAISFFDLSPMTLWRYDI